MALSTLQTGTPRSSFKVQKERGVVPTYAGATWIGSEASANEWKFRL